MGDGSKGPPKITAGLDLGDSYSYLCLVDTDSRGVRSRGALVANPRKLRLIYSNKRKTDEVGAETLARLARLDPKLLYPLKHRGEGCQAHLAIVRSRQALVDCRTQLVNHVRGAVKSFGHRLPKCPARSFHKRAPPSTSPGRSWRPKVLAATAAARNGSRS